MAGDSSFDVVSKFDQQELENAVNMTAKEVRNRYDFKGTGAAIKLAAQASMAARPSTAQRASWAHWSWRLVMGITVQARSR